MDNNDDNDEDNTKHPIIGVNNTISSATICNNDSVLIIDASIRIDEEDFHNENDGEQEQINHHDHETVNKCIIDFF